MIPKIVHTFWFGGKPKPAHIEKILRTQKAMLPDYDHREWNETNFPIDQYPVIAEAAAQGKWAHMSDYARLRVLLDHGGIYFDTDVEVRRSFDPLLGERAFIGYMWDCSLGTAVIGAEPGHEVISGLLDVYEMPDFGINLDGPNNDLFTRYFIDQVPGFKLDGKEWISHSIHILPKYSFEHPRFTNDEGYSIHHFDSSWRTRSTVKRKLVGIAKTVLGLRLYRKYVCYKSFRISPHRPEFVE